MTRPFRLLLSVVIALTLTACDKEKTEDLAHLTNQEREERNLSPLDFEYYHLGYTIDHTNDMIENQRLFHSNLNNVNCDACRLIGENVGRGSSVESVHNALMNSPAHRDNILDPRFDEMTITVVEDSNGQIWVSELFLGY